MITVWFADTHQGQSTVYSRPPGSGMVTLYQISTSAFCHLSRKIFNFLKEMLDHRIQQWLKLDGTLEIT